MSWPIAGEPPLELDDIQGHILVGFGGAPQAIGAYTARDLAAAARTVGRWTGRITTARALYAARNGRRARDVIRGSGPWSAIAVSHRLLAAAGRPALGDAWFEQEDMAEISSLNDAPPEGGGRVGSDWVVGAPGRPVDVLFIAAAGAPETAEEVVGMFTRATRDWLDGEPFVERLLPMKGAKEHFGFRDGISQPALLGTVDGELFEEDRPPDDGASLRTTKEQDLLWPGEFIFGYERGGVSDDDPRVRGHEARPPDDAAAGFARNGSLLVYRRLAQDVRRFRAFVAAKALEHAAAVPDLNGDRLEELLVGRRRDGLPLAAPPGADVKDPVAMNGFTFAGDAMARACPLAAHIRKVNPRRQTADQRLERILRRGAPYGEPYDEGEDAPPPGGRGLAFLAYQTRIEAQFGMLMTRWANHPTSPSGRGGHDLLIGQVAPGGERFFDLPSGVRVRAGEATWVRMTGGAFLFTPSISALRSLAADEE